MHALLRSQLKKSTTAAGTIDLDALSALVDDAYTRHDRDSVRTDRSITLMVEELDALNGSLRDMVAERTEELKSVRISLEATLQNSAQGIIVIDEDSRIVVCNDRALDLLDLPAELMQRKPLFDEVLRFQNARSEFAGTEEHVRALVKAGGIKNSPPIYERARPDGRILEVRTVLLAGGGAVRTFTDITAAKQHVQELERAERLHRSLFEHSAAGLYRATLDGKLTEANAALARIHNHASPAELIAAFNKGKSWRHADETRRREFRRSLHHEGQVLDYVSEVFRPETGQRMWTSETAWVVRGADGTPAYYEGSIIDVSERKAAEDKMRYMAMHDGLTGLPNRSFLMNWLQSAAGKGNPGTPIAVYCLDLDRFKEVNDSLGHTFGDALLKSAAQRMQTLLHAGSFAVRLGGDEFAIVQCDARSISDCTALARQLIRAMSEEFNLSGKIANISASIGIAIGHPAGGDGEQLLKNADIALYQAKMAGAGSSRIYDNALDAEHKNRRRIEQDLKEAVAKNQFALMFQPILSLKSNEILDYEGLIRWHHPERGMVSPADFIPVAEESELINPIGQWVLRQACEIFAACDPRIGVSVNLSPVQLRQRGFVRTVLNTLAETGLPPHRLTLEITETVLLSDNSITRASLRELRALGVKIALDDFGAGHSSLSYLKNFEFDKLKIDRSFVAGKNADRLNGAVINAVIGLGRDLGIEVIAEGIETDAQWQDLIALGCDSIQGYRIGRPEAASHWPQLLPLKAGGAGAGEVRQRMAVAG